MKKYFLMFVLSTPFLTFSQATATAHGRGGGSGLSLFNNGEYEMYKKDAS